MSEMKETMENKAEMEAAAPVPAFQKKKKKRKKKGVGIILALLILLAVVLGTFYYNKKKQTERTAASAQTVQTSSVEKRDITSELTASSSLSPKDTYEITSLVEGEVLEAPFEEGDVVEKGQILYRIDTSSVDTELTSAETSLTRARENLATAQEDYDEAASKYGRGTYQSTDTGYIKTLYIKVGDKVGNGTKIADIYNDKTMKLRIPFLSAEAAEIPVGAEAVVTIEDSGEQLGGIVTIVSNMEEALSGGRLVRYVTMEVANPGGLTATMEATASVGEFVCSEEGTFEPLTETVMNAEISGSNNLEIESLLISEGDFVSTGTALFKATDKSTEKYMRSYKDSLDSAKDSLQSAENKLKNTQDNIEDYTITAPISGTVITKSTKAGDNVTKGSSGSSTLAVIYDLSSMTLEMSVDELDVQSVKVGQAVEITADAVEGQTFYGTVTNVSLQGSYSNGVTNYPVTVTLEDSGNLLPGMNVDAVIILDSSEQTLCIPAGSLMRGNRVYVKDDSVTERQGNVPAGFRSIDVETGIINDDYVEILSGLEEGDVVYVDPNAGSSTTVNMWQMAAPAGNFGGGGGGAPSGNRGGSGQNSGGGPR